MSSPSNEFSTGAALVVGGSGAIGAAICRALALAGSNVVLTYRSNANAARAVEESIRQGGRDAATFSLDLTDATATRTIVDEATKRFGHLHSVVYAAGPAIRYLYINEIPNAEWARVFDADVNGFFNLV
ncbi:MAG: SDR family NAD(P)-dependent oxidoreductase, partial [Steroidobacteraceae bacterium]